MTLAANQGVWLFRFKPYMDLAQTGHGGYRQTLTWRFQKHFRRFESMILRKNFIQLSQQHRRLRENPAADEEETEQEFDVSRLFEDWSFESSRPLDKPKFRLVRKQTD